MKMREILFRGKRVDNGEWVEGAFLNDRDGAFYICPAVSDISYGDGGNRRRIGCWYKVDPSTVGQYTGLKDKNGKRIFEGDIAAQNWYDHDEPSDDSFGEVVFCEYDCSFSVMDIQKDGIIPLGRCHAYHWEAEVIGNIHDNPELLEAPDA